MRRPADRPTERPTDRPTDLSTDRSTDRPIDRPIDRQALRREEQKSDTFPTFCRKLLRVARRYPSPECLIPSMAKRVKRVLKHGGAMTKY